MITLLLATTTQQILYAPFFARQKQAEEYQALAEQDSDDANDNDDDDVEIQSIDDAIQEQQAPSMYACAMNSLQSLWLSVKSNTYNAFDYVCQKLNIK